MRSLCEPENRLVGYWEDHGTSFDGDMARMAKDPKTRECWTHTDDYEKAMSDFIARQPMERIGTPEEIAALAVYLASDDSGFTTGRTHAIDGGWAI